MSVSNKMSSGKLRRIANKEKAIERKELAIASLTEQLETPSRTSGSRGVKDYNASANLKIIAKKEKAIKRKKSKIKKLKA
jgi:hypothetical protein